MKYLKVYSIVIFLFCTCSSATYAQYEMGKWYLQPKISFADLNQNRDWQGYSSDLIPPFQVQVDYALTRLFSVGGQLGFSRNRYVNDTLRANVYSDYTLGLGSMASYHFAEQLERLFNYSFDLTNFDLYLSVGARIEYENSNTKSMYNEVTGLYEDQSDHRWYFHGGPSIGVRYYLNSRFAMTLDAGWADMGKVSMGLSWKLGTLSSSMFSSKKVAEPQKL